MDLLEKIDKLIVDTTVVADVAQNTAKGDVDLINDKKKKKKKKNESVVVGATYASGNSTIAGSGQTRTVGVRRNIIDVLKNKEPLHNNYDDPTKENLGRLDLKFDKLLGAYIPKTYADKMRYDDE